MKGRIDNKMGSIQIDPEVIATLSNQSMQVR